MIPNYRLLAGADGHRSCRSVPHSQNFDLERDSAYLHQSGSINSLSHRQRYSPCTSPAGPDAIQPAGQAEVTRQATREFVKSLDRKQRFDMNKGLKVEAVRVTTDKAESPEAASEASAR
jgi:hypothetical protein